MEHFEDIRPVPSRGGSVRCQAASCSSEAVVIIKDVPVCLRHYAAATERIERDGYTVATFPSDPAELLC